jgi:hypothetical protein
MRVLTTPRAANRLPHAGDERLGGDHVAEALPFRMPDGR